VGVEVGAGDVGGGVGVEAGDVKAVEMACICTELRLDNDRMDPTLEIADWIAEVVRPRMSFEAKEPWQPAQ
jgi:hypothetical protein